MYKTAVNKCPLCGGPIYLRTQVDVGYSLHGSFGKLFTSKENIIQDIFRKAPFEAMCDSCNTILDCIHVDAEKKEFTFRAEVDDEQAE